MEYALGIDVGGMSIKGAVIDKGGKIIYKYVYECKIRSGNEEFVENLKVVLDNLRDYCKENSIEVKGCGIGIPGLVDSSKNIIVSASNIKTENLDLNAALRDYNMNITISNDANVACLAEVKVGVAKNYKNSVLLTLGTGIGGGIVIDGKIFEGNKGQGAELGHMVIETDGVSCGCGRRGCFEACASATALLRYTVEEMQADTTSLMWKLVDNDVKNVNGRTSFDAAKEADPAAERVIYKYVKYLSTGIMNLNNIFRPEVFILGGGVSNQGDYLLNKIKEYCQKYNYGYKNSVIPDIKCASLKNDAGVIGAAFLVF